MKVTTMTQTIYKQLFEGSLSPLTMKEEKAYFTLARESPSESIRQRARDIIFRAHIRFIGRASLQWSKYLDMEPLELAAEASMHLYKAIDKHDLTSKYKFLSFAVYDVKNAFLLAHKKSKPVFGMKKEDLKNLVHLDMPMTAEGDGESTRTMKEELWDLTVEPDRIASENAESARSVIMPLLEGMPGPDRDLLERCYGFDFRGDKSSVGDIAIERGVPKHQVAHRLGNLKRQAQRILRKQHILPC